MSKRYQREGVPKGPSKTVSSRERSLWMMRTKALSKSPLPLSYPSQTHNSTYWESVIAEARANDSPSGAFFVAAGFDMWVVWSQIVTELRHSTDVSNTLLTEIYLPDYDRHGFPSFRDADPTDGKKVPRQCYQG